MKEKKKMKILKPMKTREQSQKWTSCCPLKILKCFLGYDKWNWLIKVETKTSIQYASIVDVIGQVFIPYYFQPPYLILIPETEWIFVSHVFLFSHKCIQDYEFVFDMCSLVWLSTEHCHAFRVYNHRFNTQNESDEFNDKKTYTPMTETN